MANNSKTALFGTLSEFWKAGTQELSKNVSSVMSAPTTNSAPKSGNLISNELEKWEKDVIDQRKHASNS